MLVVVIVLASLLTLAVAALAFCVRVFVTAPGARSLTNVWVENGTEVWAWQPWRGWRLCYRLTVGTTPTDYALGGHSSTVAS